MCRAGLAGLELARDRPLPRRVGRVFAAWAGGAGLRQRAGCAGRPGTEGRFDPALVGVRRAEGGPAFAGIHFGTVGDQGQELP